MLNQFNNIFKQDEIIGFKDNVEDYQPYKLQPSATTLPNFYCINPIKSYSDLKYENIKEFRNFLIEFDSARLSTQERWVKETGLPYSLQTFSGSKSYHFIVSLNKGIELEEYKQLAAIMLKYIFRDKADESCANPNRLSRTPGAMRGEKEQKLIAQLPAIEPDQLRHWVYEVHKNCYMSYKVNKEIEEERRFKTQQLYNTGSADSADLINIFIPDWQQILMSDKVSAGNRHRTAVGVGIKLYQCGMDPDTLLEHTQTFLELNGKSNGAYKEAHNIITWISKRIVPYNFDQITLD